MQLGIQVLGLVSIVAWTGFTSFVLFGVLSKLNLLRIDASSELVGIDVGLLAVHGFGLLVLCARIHGFQTMELHLRRE